MNAISDDLIAVIIGDHWQLCGSRKYSYSPHGRSLEIPRGRGVLKSKMLEEKYEAKLEFPKGEGMQNKKPSMGARVWIFSGAIQLLAMWKPSNTCTCKCYM